MASTLLRTLTRKSRLNVWNLYSTVQDLIDRKKQMQLIAAYYKLTTINYTDDILDELKITSEWKIEKPGADKELYYKFLNENGYKKRGKRKADKLKRSLWELNIGLDKSWLQSKNHGK